MKVRADSLSHTADIFGATRSAAAVVHSCFFSEKKMENFFTGALMTNHLLLATPTEFMHGNK